MLFDWMMVGGILEINRASSVDCGEVLRISAEMVGFSVGQSRSRAIQV
jgi:hypothetical protein